VREQFIANLDPKHPLFLDDASRLIPHAQFYTSQGLDSALDCLHHAMVARGIPIRLYIDDVKIYRSPQLARITASLGILITMEEQTPQIGGGWDLADVFDIALPAQGRGGSQGAVLGAVIDVFDPGPETMV